MGNETQNKLLFEVSWETCNKVGGIYTVLSSKISPMQKKYNKDYFLIGPYFSDGNNHEFEHQPAPEYIKKAIDEMLSIGIQCHYGKWLIDGEPSVILIDYSTYPYNNNEIKRILWECFKIDSLGTSYYDFDTPVLWSWCVGMLLNKIESNSNSKIIAHVHEWLSGACILHLKINNSKISTIFTTHATILGRTLVDHTENLQESLKHINPEEEARKHGIIAKYQIEKQSAINADVFTTVSDITGDEAEKILGRKPDVITYNGLNIESIATLEEITNKRRISKTRILELLIELFAPAMDFDINKTTIFATFGRYEMRTKGLDILSEALGNLNKKLKEEGTKDNVICFYFIPAAASGVRNEIILSKGRLGNVKSALEEKKETVNLICLKSIIDQKKMDPEELFESEPKNNLKLYVKKFKRDMPTIFCTHYMANEEHDPILYSFKNNNLLNKADDPVKVIFYPVYLTGSDHLMDLTYRQAICGIDLGIYPSLYEPWGYTPLETASLATPAITTNLSGFGRYIEKCKNCNKGVFIIDRKNTSTKEASIQLTNIMYDYLKLNANERDKLRIKARELTHNADWKVFADLYFKAHELALKKHE
jgi:glycogen synthase